MLNIDKEELKSKVDMLKLCNILGIEVKRVGSGYKALCPFHSESDASFSIDSVRGLYNCFGCNRGGDVIKLVSDVKSVGFKEALGFLGEHFGNGREILRSAQNDSGAQGALRQAQGTGLLAKAVDHYHECLKHSSKGIDYLKKRGIWSLEVINYFKLGYCDWSFKGKVTSDELKVLTEAGIFKNTPQRHEHFNGCIVFPVIDDANTVCEIYGRKIRTRESEGYPSHLYLPGPHCGIFNEKAFESRELIVCESIIDALTFYVNGFHNVTSSYGVNGFTSDHLRWLKGSRVTRVYIAYDNDTSGQQAASKLTEELKDLNIDLIRVLVPNAKDVNEYSLLYKENERKEALKRLLDEVIRDFAPSEKSVVIRDFDVRTNNGELRLTLKDIGYRVRGIDSNSGYEHMKVNLKVSRLNKFHLDVLDLYSSKQRAAFMRQASSILEVDDSVLSKDVSILLEQVERMHESLLVGALVPVKETVKISETDEVEALNYLKNPSLIKELLSDFSRMGYVGEDINKIIVYLCCVSHLLDDPLSVMVVSRSAAGKSSLQDAVLRFVPDEAKVKFTAMTGQSLFYMDKDSLKHKVLAISENEGASDAFYALKTMESERELRIASTGKDAVSGKMRTHEYRVKGPVALLLTTTDVELDHELSNRFITLSVDEDSNQTERIHNQQRFEETLEGLLTKKTRDKILTKHQNAMRLLRKLSVVNPFAEKLKFMTNRLRSRRDHKKYLGLIKAITFLFQHQRVVKEREGLTYIETTVDDIGLANKLAKDVFTRSLDDLVPPSRKLLNIISEMIRAKKEKLSDDEVVSICRMEISQYSGWSQWQVRRHIKPLEELGFIQSIKTRRGQRFEYELLYDGNETLDIGLIDPDLLV